MLNATLPPWPSFTREDAEAVSRVLLSNRVNYWTGTEGRAFEREFADAVGAAHGVALANGTVALEAALFALGIGPGDDVLVPCRTFIATASAVAMRGARPVAADVDLQSQNVTAETLDAAVTPQTRAVIAVHLAGWPCEMDAILAWARGRGLKVVEDCAQAHGAACRGRMAGALGDVAAFSFCQDKIMTTGGEGGLLTTNDDAIAARAWAYKDHGKNRARMERPAAEPGFRWVHDAFGTNGRMTEMQAAIGRRQLGQLADWVATRRRHAARLDERFRNTPALRVTVPPPHARHAYYKYYVFVEPERLRAGWDRDRILREMQARGVPCGSGICPDIRRERAFDRPGWRSDRPLDTARRLGETSLMLLVHPTLTDDHVQRVGDTLHAIMGEAARP